MGIIGGEIGYRMLRAIGGEVGRSVPHAPGPLGDARMVECFGADIFERLSSHSTACIVCHSTSSTLPLVELSGVSCSD